MIIKQNIHFLYNLFPEAKDDEQKLMDAVKRYYSVGPYEPQLKREGEQVHITLDVDRIEADKNKYAKLVSLGYSVYTRQQLFKVQNTGILLRELVTGRSAYGKGTRAAV